MDIWELATKIRQEARSKRKIRMNLTRSAKMYNWIQEPKGKDKEIIEKYYCGVKIIMNDGKILLENVYTLEEIYLKIDELAESLNMEKIDEYYYVPKNKTGADLKNKNQSDLGKFVYNQLGIGAKVWFIENVKEWFWLHKEDGMIKLETGEEFY